MLYAEREIDTAQHDMQTAEALLESVNDHVKAGLAVESDRMSAQVNLAACKQSLIAAEGDRELAWSDLQPGDGRAEIWLSFGSPRSRNMTFLRAIWHRNSRPRPRLARTWRRWARPTRRKGSTTSAARLNYGPHVNVYGNLENDAASFGGANGNNWVAGVQVSIDLLPLGKHAQLAHENAARARVNAQLEAYRQRVRVEVDQAHIQLETARQSMQTSHAAIDQATESLRIVKNRYTAGLATITELLRAEDAERQSQTNYWRAVYRKYSGLRSTTICDRDADSEAAENLQ